MTLGITNLSLPTPISGSGLNDQDPRPEVATWIRQARESIKQFGGIIGGASVPVPEEEGHLYDDEEDLADDTAEEDVDEHAVADDDEVEVLPPVSGG